ncbi:probable serine/threonine-protein kinase DDB_G0272282 [Oppia nitens]|uniref:probable serine/threonine-protein kinase DDB_G0272282 n=1 Tax=Oppia nitens TaxID=1686743 RepID=UPI0023DB4E37|nr:probable serine/threonine-protein kinase DDB_G0272282 [Oppia nitens]
MFSLEKFYKIQFNTKTLLIIAVIFVHHFVIAQTANTSDSDDKQNMSVPYIQLSSTLTTPSDSPPVQRRGSSVSDQFKGVLNNILKPLNLEVPKVKQMSQLFSQLFPTITIETAPTYHRSNRSSSLLDNYQMAGSVNRHRYPSSSSSTAYSRHKGMNDFGYTFNEPLRFITHLESVRHTDSGIVAPYDDYTNTKSIDTGMGSESMAAHPMADNPISGDEMSMSSNTLKNIVNLDDRQKSNTDLFVQSNYSKLPDYITKSGRIKHLSIPTETVYGQHGSGSVVNDYYPTYEGETPIITAEPNDDLELDPQKSLVVKYNNFQLTGGLQKSPKSLIYNNNNNDNLTDGNDNSMMMSTTGDRDNNNNNNLLKTASELKVVHYLQDFYNNTHEEFNTMADKLYGKSSQNNDNNNTNNLSLMEFHSIGPTVESAERPKYRQQKYSLKMESGFDWRPMLGPKPMVGRTYGWESSQLKPQIVDPLADQTIENEKENHLKTQLNGNIKSYGKHNHEDIDDEFKGNLLPDHHMTTILSGNMLSRPRNAKYGFVNSPHHSIRMLSAPSALYETQMLDSHGEASVEESPIIYNIPSIAKPMVHRIRDFLRNILFPK